MEIGTQSKSKSKRNWATMDIDSLSAIFNRLPFVDLLRAKSVCWGWLKAIDLFEGYSASTFPEIPWLIFPPMEISKKAGHFLNIEENKLYPFNDLAVKKLHDGYCRVVGSSLDWLVCVDNQPIPYLLNPFSSHRIDLPPLVSFSGVVKVESRIIRANLAKKAVLSSSPSFGNNYYLAIICKLGSGLIFCKDGDSSWTKLDSDFDEHSYDDIIFHENRLYGIYEDQHGCDYIQVWDMNQHGFLIVKKIDVVLNQPMAVQPIPSLSGGILTRSRVNFYLAESQRNLLLVRKLTIYKHPQTPDNIEGLSRSKARSQFNVFKLDVEQGLWRGVESLSGYALFLGRNQSVSVDVRNCKRLKQDAIYSSDEKGHFSKVFSLKDKRVYNLYGNQNSSPIWVVPRMKRLN